MTPTGLRIDLAVTIAAAPDHVWHVLVDQADRWWTHRHRPDATVLLDATPGGTFRQEWDGGGLVLATVLLADPPHALRLAGQLAMTRAAHNLVDITLQPDPDGTRLTLAHTGFGDLDPGTEQQYTDGWAELVDTRLRTAAEA